MAAAEGERLPDEQIIGQMSYVIPGRFRGCHVLTPNVASCSSQQLTRLPT